MDEKLRPPQTYGPGDTFAGKFRIISLIGSGGFGSVYKAHDLNLGRDVALKVLHSWVLADSDNRARFIREAKILTDLHDPNIIHVYSFGIEENGRCYMSMEFLQGKTLTACLDGSRALEWREAARIGVQICHAVGVAHAHGIVHRDLKPDNIMLVPSPDGSVVKVLDFGLCGVLPEGPKELQRLTQTGTVLGTAHYMSPEVCMGLKADQRSDVYSVGCVLYQLLSGRKPITTDDAIAVMLAQTKELPERLNTPQEETVPLDLELSVFKAIQKDADERFQSMQAFEEALNAVIAGDQPALKRDSVKLSSAKHGAVHLPAQRKFHPALAWTALAVFLATTIGISFTLKSKPTTDELFFQASSTFKKARNPALTEEERRQEYAKAATLFTEVLMHAPSNYRYSDDARLQRLLCYAQNNERQKIRDDGLTILRTFRVDTDPWNDLKYEANHQLSMVNLQDKRLREAKLFAGNAVGLSQRFTRVLEFPFIEANLDYAEAYWQSKSFDIGAKAFEEAFRLLPPFDSHYANELRMQGMSSRHSDPEASKTNTNGPSYTHDDLMRDIQQSNLRRAVAAKLTLARAYLGETASELPRSKKKGLDLVADIMILHTAGKAVPELPEAQRLWQKYNPKNVPLPLLRDDMAE